MQPHSLTRRDFLKNSAILASPMLLAAADSSKGAAGHATDAKLKIVCVGGHPDDPESGCAGTLARYSELGHLVTVIYLTRGERGVRDKGLDEAAKIRSAECENACKIMGAKAVFFGQIDGATEVTKVHVDAMTKLLSTENADVVFTHW